MARPKQPRLTGIPAPSLRERWHNRKGRNLGTPLPVQVAMGLVRRNDAFWMSAPGRVASAVARFAERQQNKFWIGAPLVLALLLSVLYNFPAGLPYVIGGQLAQLGAQPQAPTKVQWVTVGNHPITRPGFLPDGTFSAEEMKNAWIAAGLDPSALYAAGGVARQARIMIAFRDDPQMLRDASRASEKEIAAAREYDGDALAALEKALLNPGKEPGCKADEARGALEQEIVRLYKKENDIPYTFTINNAGFPFAFSLAERIDTLEKWNADHPQPLRVPLPHLLRVGNEGAGPWSGKLMLAAWRAAGMSAAMAELALAGTRDLMVDWRLVKPSEAAAAATKARAAGYTFDSEFGASTARGRPVIDPDILLAKGAKSSARGSARDWENLERALTRGPAFPDAPSDLTMAQAKAELERVGLAVGLRSLLLSPVEFETPQRVWLLAQGLERANAELEQLSGWKGGVLGLNGRVELTLRSPWEYSAFGIANMGPDGRLEIVTAWSALAHEWFHAVDMVARTHALSRPIPDPLTNGVARADLVRAPKVVAAAMAIKAVVDDPKSRWKQTRQALEEEDDREYLARPSEAAAFAFGALASSKALPILGSGSLRVDRAAEPQRVPTDADLDTYGGVVDAYFRSLDGLDWTGRPFPKGAAHANPERAGPVARWIRKDNL